MRPAAVLLLVVASVGCGSTNTASTPSPSPTPSGPSEWPMYAHDVTHSSVNLNEVTITPSNVANLSQAWQVDLGSSNGVYSNSTPTIVGGRVYVGSSASPNANFFAVDAGSGQIVWGANLGYQFNPACDPLENVGIPSTAAVTGGVVTVGGGDAAYYGLDAATGTILWRQPLNAGPSGFAWSSPAVGNGIVYFGASSQCDNPPVRGELRAVNLADGSLVASQFFGPVNSPGGGGGIWNSPAMTADAQTVVVVTGEDNGDNWPTQQAVVTLDPTTLAIEQASKQGTVGGDLDFGTSPVVFFGPDGSSYIGASQKTGIFYAFSVNNLAAGPVWSRNLGVVVGATPAYDPSLGTSGTLFVAGTDGAAQYNGGNGMLYALDPATGNDRWSSPSPIGNIANNMAIVNGLIFVNASMGGVRVINETTGQIVQTLIANNIGPTLSGIAVAEGAVFWMSGSFLNCWRPPTIQ